jgi:hypothetical protein
MQTHSLSLDVLCDEKYCLVGIHTTLEDYKLAYLLNKHLGTHFYKSKEDLNVEILNKITVFSLFNYSHIKYDFEWFLLANSAKRENRAVLSQLLFTSETKTYLIPEKKKVDFFIKITGNVPYSFLVEIINKIKIIDQVITSYSIDKNTLKSKDFLIF